MLQSRGLFVVALAIGIGHAVLAWLVGGHEIAAFIAGLASGWAAVTAGVLASILLKSIGDGDRRVGIRIASLAVAIGAHPALLLLISSASGLVVALVASCVVSVALAWLGAAAVRGAAIP